MKLSPADLWNFELCCTKLDLLFLFDGLPDAISIQHTMTRRIVQVNGGWPSVFIWFSADEITLFVHVCPPKRRWVSALEIVWTSNLRASFTNRFFVVEKIRYLCVKPLRWTHCCVWRAQTATFVVYYSFYWAYLHQVRNKQFWDKCKEKSLKIQARNKVATWNIDVIQSS